MLGQCRYFGSKSTMNSCVDHVLTLDVQSWVTAAGYALSGPGKTLEGTVCMWCNAHHSKNQSQLLLLLLTLAGKNLPETRDYRILSVYRC
jgi:hypothetical protein